MKKTYIITLAFIILSIFTSCTGANDVRIGMDVKSGTAIISKAEKTPDPAQSTKPISGQLKVHFIDVGQADSILVQAPSGKTMLIDAGNNGDGNTVVNYLKSQGVGKVDVLVGTHPHEDHVGGLDTVINSFDIGSIYMPKVSSTTKTFQDILMAVKNKGLKVITAAAGVTLDIGEGIKTEIIAPNSTDYKDLNDWSAVIKLTYGNTSFLFAGDSESVSEKEILNKSYDLKADVLKVAHHGSGSSTTAGFLENVKPKYAVIQVGKGNDYGHPHKPVMQRLQERGITVYRNDQNGTIIATSDGSTLEFNVKPGDYSYAGEGKGTTKK